MVGFQSKIFLLSYYTSRLTVPDRRDPRSICTGVLYRDIVQLCQDVSYLVTIYNMCDTTHDFCHVPPSPDEGQESEVQRKTERHQVLAKKRTGTSFSIFFP
jgi:hypothetical protein